MISEEGAFRFDHLTNALLGDSAHFHVYRLMQLPEDDVFRLDLGERLSTDANGIAASLGLQTNHKMELDHLMKILAAKISEDTLFTLL
ncbi:MAG TPA: hypothetical protein VNE38_05065 [Ktedonobacteraceae bacterium]|nr:hypothetical protein [Ktedonobacteraceae bacterium]